MVLDAVSVPLVSLDDIRAAAGRIRPLARRTPLLEVPPLHVKCENLQTSGAFKIRGASNMLAQLSVEARKAGVITYSSGNHGQAVACAAARFGARVVVVMPTTAPSVKVERTRRFGAEVIFAGTTLSDRRGRAEVEAAARGLTMVPPFDHAWIIAGAGTVGLEVLEDCPQVASVYVPVGGGGLISGIAAAVKQMRSGVRVIGVEPAGAARMSASLAAGQPVTLERAASIADGLCAARPGDLTFAHVQALVDEMVTVDDSAIAAAVAWLFSEARIAAEPSGAAAVAGALQRQRSGAGATVAIVSGGNVNPADYAHYIAASSTR